MQKEFLLQKNDEVYDLAFLRLLYFLKKNRYGQRRIIMDYKIWIAMVVLGEKSEYAIAHLHCSLRTIYTCPISNIAFFCFWKAVFWKRRSKQMKASPKGSLSLFFSPLHSHQKALPFGYLGRATLPFLNLRQQDSVFFDYLPDGLVFWTFISFGDTPYTRLH